MQNSIFNGFGKSSGLKLIGKKNHNDQVVVF